MTQYKELPSQRFTAEYQNRCIHEIRKLQSEEARQVAWLLVYMGLELSSTTWHETRFVLPGSQKGRDSVVFLVRDNTEFNKDEHLSPGDLDYTYTELIIAQHHQKNRDEWDAYFTQTPEEAIKAMEVGNSIGLVATLTKDGGLEISSPKATRKLLISKKAFESGQEPPQMLPKKVNIEIPFHKLK